MSKKTKRSISTFAILLAVMLLVSIVTWIAAGKTYTGENGEIAEVVGATSSDIFMAPSTVGQTQLTLSRSCSASARSLPS